VARCNGGSAISWLAHHRTRTTTFSLPIYSKNYVAIGSHFSFFSFPGVFPRKQQPSPPPGVLGRF
jgi:hypothetical protein